MSAESNMSSRNAPQAFPWNRWLGRAVAALTVLMCVYLGATIWATRSDLARVVEQFSPQVLLSTIGLVLLGLALRAVRWHYYLIRLRWQVPLHHSIAAFLASFAFTATPGKAGEVVKAFLLRTRYEVPLAAGFGVLLVERLSDLLAVLILAAGGLGLLSDATIYFLVTGAVVGAITFIVSNRWLYYPIISQGARIKRLAGIVNRLLGALDTCRALLQPVPFLLGVGIALVAWGCEAWAFHLVIRSVGLETEILKSFSIYGVATLVGALSGLPGGLGSFEVVMVFLLTRLAMPVATATVSVVVLRLCSLWLGSLIGLIFMFGWLWLVGSGDADASSREASNE